jgi:hypothetical protein
MHAPDRRRAVGRCGYITIQHGLVRTWLACLCPDVSAAAWIIANLHGLSDAETPGETAALTGLRTILARLPGNGTNPPRITRAMSWQIVGLSTLPGPGMLGRAVASLFFGACAACPPGRRLKLPQTSRTFT